MARQTSIAAYHAIQENGILTGLKWSVYAHLYEHGPQTGKEIILSIGQRAQHSGTLTTRLSELKTQGAVRECGRKICQYSGHEVILWDVTDRVPVPLKKPPKFGDRLTQLEERVTAIESRLVDRSVDSRSVDSKNGEDHERTTEIK